MTYLSIFMKSLFGNVSQKYLSILIITIYNLIFITFRCYWHLVLKYYHIQTMGNVILIVDIEFIYFEFLTYIKLV